ncbi:hypothetical protein ACQFYA_01830 [Promicromonospora sp. Marseille-Q5078]
MTQLDLDTTTLAAAGAGLRGGAGALAGARGHGLTAGAALAATGDAGLSAALGELSAAWRSTHESLVGSLGALGSGLAQAAEVFDGAERATTRDVVALLAGAGAEGDA